MINLPAYSGAALLALLLADLLMLFLFILAAGPVFVAARDAFGRPLERVGIFKRLLLALLALIFGLYLALQAGLMLRFYPYFVDSASVATEQIQGLTVYPDEEHPIAYWITTERHRFGVSEDIFHNLSVGDEIAFRYRALDDTLYEIHVVRYANGLTPRASPAP